MVRRTLRDRRVVITGASSGIGRHLALELADRGARLLLSARRRELLHSLAEECRARGAAAEYIAGDVADEACRADLAAFARDRWGGIDMLVNNAGVSAHACFADSDESTLRRIMEVNFFAAAELTRRALPLLAAGRQPAIVNVGSVLGHRGVPLTSEYCASKFALRGWSEALRVELAPRGIDVLLVSPGTTDTDFFAHLIADKAQRPWGATPSISPAVVARQIAGALQRGRREIFPNWRGRGFVLANRLTPSLVDRVLLRLAKRAARQPPKTSPDCT
ncbi:MAG: glucose dehydrogenase [Planctomycetota bacterium]|nr:MAG: glucose dehydrogenase [Planctomycetota bacterium]